MVDSVLPGKSGKIDAMNDPEILRPGIQNKAILIYYETSTMILKIQGEVLGK